MSSGNAPKTAKSLFTSVPNGVKSAQCIWFLIGFCFKNDLMVSLWKNDVHCIVKVYGLRKNRDDKSAVSKRNI